MNSKYVFSLFFMLVCGIAMISAPMVVSAEEIAGTPDDTPGVFLFSAGGEELSPGACNGVPADTPGPGIIQDSITFDIFEYLGSESADILDFVAGSEAETPDPGGQVDTTATEIITGLTAIDDFGDISFGGDDDANYDAGTSGGLTLSASVSNTFQGVGADGVVTDGVIGGSTAAGSVAEANDHLGGMEIFIFEDGELSGFELELFSLMNSWVIKIDDYQVNPNTQNAADDTFIGIDLDSLPGWDGSYIIEVRITDDGIEQATVDSCDGLGALDSSLEIDAIVVRSEVMVQALAVTMNNQTSSGSSHSLLWMAVLGLGVVSLPLLAWRKTPNSAVFNWNYMGQKDR